MTSDQRPPGRTKDSRQLVVRGDQATDERASRRADAARGADGAECLGARGHVGEEDRRQDVDRRDQQRGPDALQERIAE